MKNNKFLMILLNLSLLFLFYNCSCGENTKTTTLDLGDWPGPHNAGLSNSSLLTDFNFPGSTKIYTITVDGTTLENLRIDGQINIKANNVTIRNCRIIGEQWYGILINSGTGILIDHCEIGKTYSNGIKGIGAIARDDGTPLTRVEYTIQYCYFHHVEDGINVGQAASLSAAYHEAIIQNNYITDLIEIPGVTHNDGIHCEGPAKNFYIRNNNIQNVDQQTSCIYFRNTYGVIDNLVIEHNFLNGGQYTFYLRGDTSGNNFSFTNVTIKENYFGRDYLSLLFSPDTSNPVPFQASGNVWFDTEKSIAGDKAANGLE
jgi:hypothetical protein